MLLACAQGGLRFRHRGEAFLHPFLGAIDSGLIFRESSARVGEAPFRLALLSQELALSRGTGLKELSGLPLGIDVHSLSWSLCGPTLLIHRGHADGRMPSMIAPRTFADPGDTSPDEDASQLDGQAIAAAIDIGSNSIKMTVARPLGDGGLEQIAWASEVVRLGEGLDETGKLDEERIDLAVDTLARFAAQARTLGAETLVAVATEATRAATNGQEFLDRVRRETGVAVRVIDGLEEAALTFRGLAATTNLEGTIVIADIGGGSTELIVAHDGTMHSARSIPLGSGRLTARCVREDPPLAAEIVACEAAADEALRLATKLEPLPAEARLIVVGGTGEYLTRLVVDAEAIEVSDVRSALAKMTVLTAAELADAIEAPEARARVLPAGVAIVAALATRVQPAHIEISRSGVRAGLLYEAFSQARAVTTESPGKATDASPSPITPAGKVHAATPPGEGFRETMNELIAERWRAVWEVIPAALDGHDIEGVHDVRVASRRLRAAMDTAAPAFPQEWFKRLHKTAKQITRELGEVRDRDVLLVALSRERDNAPLAERPGIDRLIYRVERERVAARADMERFLEKLLSGAAAEEIERQFGCKLPTHTALRRQKG